MSENSNVVSMAFNIYVVDSTGERYLLSGTTWSIQDGGLVTIWNGQKPVATLSNPAYVGKADLTYGADLLQSEDPVVQ